MKQEKGKITTGFSTDFNGVEFYSIEIEKSNGEVIAVIRVEKEDFFDLMRRKADVNCRIALPPCC